MTRFWRNALSATIAAGFMAITLPVPGALAAVAPTEGAWTIDQKIAVQFFDCHPKLCGRLAWMKAPRDAQGQLKLDRHNPDPKLQARRMCGPTIIWNLQADGPNRWEDGWLYNPDDGETYNVAVERKTSGAMEARIYAGLPVLGTTKSLHQVPTGTSAGWC